MAVPAHAVTISRAAKLLGQDEELLWELATDMDAASGSTTLASNRQSPSPTADWKTCRSWSLSISAGRHPRGPERRLTVRIALCEGKHNLELSYRMRAA